MYKLKTISYIICKDNETLKGFPKISAELIENSAEYNIYIKTNIQDKLYEACRYGKLKIFNYLVSQGANIRAYNDDTIQLASQITHALFSYFFLIFSIHKIQFIFTKKNL